VKRFTRREIHGASTHLQAPRFIRVWRVTLKFDDMAETLIFLYILPNGKAGKSLKQANSEAIGAVEARQLAFETTQVFSEAREGKPRAKRQDRPQHANKQHFRPPRL
jgi:hypothetical protein